MKKIFCLVIILLGAVLSNAQNRSSAEKSVRERVLKPGGKITASDIQDAFNRVIAFADSSRFSGKTIGEMRSLTASQCIYTQTFFCKEAGKEGNWRYDPGDNTSTDDGATVLVTSSGMRLKRVIVNNIVFAEWWGAVADGTTDCTSSLQSAIDYTVVNGLTLLLKNGTYKTTAGLNVGTTSSQSSANSSFSIKGVAAALGTSGGNGSRIRVSGTGIDAVLKIRRSAWYLATFEDFTLASETQDGAAYGFMFETIGFTQHRLKGIRAQGVNTAFAILKGGRSNGEFVTFDRCVGGNVNRFFFMESDCGQSLNHLFIHCSAQIRSGGACWEIGGSNLGYGIHSIEFESSGTDTVTGYTYFINNGISGTCVFTGGRVEHCGTVVNSIGGSSAKNNTISFRDVEFSGMRSTSSVPFLVTTSTNAVYQYVFTACKFTMSSYAGNALTTSLSPSDGSLFRFVNCLFAGPNLYSYVAAGNTGSLEFEDCSYAKYNSGESGVTGAVYRFSKSNRKPALGTMGKNSVVSQSIWAQPGVPSNLLVYPDFGTTFGNNISAPSPWVHVGTSSFAILNGWGVSQMTVSSSPTARVIRLNTSSSVYQDVAAVTFSANPTSATYQALISATGGGLKITLENSSTGKVYDVFEQAATGGTSEPFAVTLFATDAAVGGNLRVRIENPSSSSTSTVQFMSQLVTQKFIAGYVNPPAGTTKEFSHYWSANQDMVRVYGRLSIPHKNDITGSAAASLPDVESDIYLSTNTERIKYFANGKWWEAPRTTYAASAPSTGTWAVGDQVYNTVPAPGGFVGWICVTAGTPGTWKGFGLIEN